MTQGPASLAALNLPAQGGVQGRLSGCRHHGYVRTHPCCWVSLGLHDVRAMLAGARAQAPASPWKPDYSLGVSCVQLRAEIIKSCDILEEERSLIS